MHVLAVVFALVGLLSLPGTSTPSSSYEPNPPPLLEEDTVTSANATNAPSTTVNVFFCMNYWTAPRTPVIYDFKVSSPPNECLPSKTGGDHRFAVTSAGFTCTSIGQIQPKCTQETLWVAAFGSLNTGYWGVMNAFWSMDSSHVKVRWGQFPCGVYLCRNKEACDYDLAVLPRQQDPVSLYIIGNPNKCYYSLTGGYLKGEDDQFTLNMDSDQSDL